MCKFPENKLHTWHWEEEQKHLQISGLILPHLEIICALFLYFCKKTRKNLYFNDPNRVDLGAPWSSQVVWISEFCHQIIIDSNREVKKITQSEAKKKNTLGGLKRRLDEVEDRISDLEDR